VNAHNQEEKFPFIGSSKCFSLFSSEGKLISTAKASTTSVCVMYVCLWLCCFLQKRSECAMPQKVPRCHSTLLGWLHTRNTEPLTLLQTLKTRHSKSNPSNSIADTDIEGPSPNLTNTDVTKTHTYIHTHTSAGACHHTSLQTHTLEDLPFTQTNLTAPRKTHPDAFHHTNLQTQTLEDHPQPHCLALRWLRPCLGWRGPAAACCWLKVPAPPGAA